MRVIGTIVEEESGKPLAGLQIRAFDKDLLWDDKLGVTTTDAAGAFRIDYDLNAVGIIHLETMPDLYIRVFDATGKKLLYTSEKSVRKDPMIEEEYHLKIPRAKLV